MKHEDIMKQTNQWCLFRIIGNYQTINEFSMVTFENKSKLILSLLVKKVLLYK